MTEVRSEAVRSELLAFGRYLQAHEGEFHAREAGDEDLIQLSIKWCKDRLCPRSAEIIAASTSRSGDLTVAITEVVLWKLGSMVPGIPTIARTIAVMGIERFCREPQALLFPVS